MYYMWVTEISQLYQNHLIRLTKTEGAKKAPG